ncbi:MAG: hypothetical protein VKO21_02625 [Candidatus Sericytochromatia bacterium]|nr:hypothetical protein [Candidatus Sericytochromatia bacterium]
MLRSPDTAAAAPEFRLPGRSSWAAASGAVLIAWLFTLAGRLSVQWAPVSSSATASWTWGWDGGWYLGLAKEGWISGPDGELPQGAAFLPAWPLLLRSAFATGLPEDLVGQLLPTLLQLAWLAFLHAYVRPAGARMAFPAVLFAALWPHSLTGRVAYTEPLFLLCGTLMLTLGRRHAAVAAVAGLFAGTTRVTGLALGLMALDRGRPWRLLTFLAPALGLIGVMGWQGLVLGDPMAFLHAQHHWHEGRPPGSGGWLGPLGLGLLGPIGHNGVLKAVMVAGTVAVVSWGARGDRGAAAAAGGHLLLVLASGWTESGDRYLYGSPALWWLLMPLLTKHPRLTWFLAVLSAAVTVGWARQWILGRWVF